MPGNLYIKVLREFATVKASVWTFKTGNASDEELIDPKHSNVNT